MPEREVGGRYSDHLAGSGTATPQISRLGAGTRKGGRLGDGEEGRKRNQGEIENRRKEDICL